MTLRIKVLLVFAVGLLMLLAVQYVTARTVILDQVAALEEEKGLSVLEQLENLLMDRSQQLASINSDWASWDDTYQFMEDGSPAYLASNYTPSTFSRLKIDGIVVMALDGKPAYVRGMREETGESWEVPPELLSWIKEQILPVGSSEEGIKGALKLAGKYYQISVEPILTSDGSGPSRGVMAMVRVMEGKFLGRLSRIGLLP
ncbi:MAG: hypothetical protein G8345_13225, partial [Magnetococcales bacterium]|nr:hypothetical protein [Magnetococcales bacterium]